MELSPPEAQIVARCSFVIPRATEDSLKVGTPGIWEVSSTRYDRASDSWASTLPVKRGLRGRKTGPLADQTAMGLPCSSMRDLAKAARKAIRELAGLAYDRELSDELKKLESRVQDC